MASVIKLKRRASGGAAGSPASLKTTEPAFNETDNTLYLGFGDDGSGNATSIVPIGGKGAFADLTSAQTIAGVKTFSSSPIAPTPAGGDNTTKVATTAFVTAALLASATGADTYQGTWNATTNTPSLASNTGSKGYYYKVSVAGSTALNGITDWKIGDWAIFNGSVWEKVDQTESVSTVNGQSGAVVLAKSDVGLGNVDNTSDATKNAAVATLTNKTLTSPVINSPTGIVKGDVGLGNVDNTSDATKNAASVTLTNKTLTSPVINSPTGIVKADVGLGNVDNTSDATKNAASVTLTNKTLTAPIINGGTIDSVTIDGGTF